MELIPEEDEQIVSQLGILFDEDFLFFTFGCLQFGCYTAKLTTGLNCGMQGLQSS